MTGYTKLFGSIIASTIWREDDKTRIVWITMLALADRNGEVHASVPGLADLSRVTVDECRVAIDKLGSPDIDSRSKAEDGRRILPMDGGWVLVNHHKYRKFMSVDERKEYNRLKQQECRARQQNVSTCQQMSKLVNPGQQMLPPSAQAEAAPEAAPAPKATLTKRPPRPPFQKPTVDQLRLLCAKSGVRESEADGFYDHYESNGWKVGKNPMVSWEASWRGWIRRHKSEGQQSLFGICAP